MHRSFKYSYIASRCYSGIEFRDEEAGAGRGSSACRSLGSDGIWTHVLGGGYRQDIEDAGVDWEWRPDMPSGRYPLQSNG